VHKVYAQTLTSPIMPPRMQLRAGLQGGLFDEVFGCYTNI
jgi:hypothetical protein